MPVKVKGGDIVNHRTDPHGDWEELLFDEDAGRPSER